MFYYRIKGFICCAWESDLPYAAADDKERAEVSKFLFRRDPAKSRAVFLVNHPALLYQTAESAEWLSLGRLTKAADRGISPESPAEQGIPDPEVMAAIEAGRLGAVNIAHPRFPEIMDEHLSLGEMTKKTVHILAIGDVGSNVLTGLHLLGGDCIRRIGICDISDKVTARWEFEENQIAYPWDYDALPEVYVVDREHLFDCDVFVFVASAGIPPVGSGIKDVRMYQFEKNSRIIAEYAKMARNANFRGLFCEVADPVDPLCKAAYLASNTDENGKFDGKGLVPEQIQGYGLGVMNARAAYYAKKDERFRSFLSEGRTFGPHGQELVVANSIEHYDDGLSKELTKLTVTANLRMREIGFKPFVAPAYSSGALSILLTIRGEWHCSSVFLGGIYMGVKNRYTINGQETEILKMPDELFERIRDAEKALHAIN